MVDYTQGSGQLQQSQQQLQYIEQQKQYQGLSTKQNSLVWNPTQNQLHDGVQLSPAEQEYLLPHFNMLLVGKPGSGKTQLLHQIVTNSHMYYKKFDYVFLVSPSFAKMGLDLHEDNQVGKFDLGWVFSKIEEVNQKQQERIFKRNVATYRGAKEQKLEKSLPTKSKTSLGQERFNMEEIKSERAEKTGRTAMPLAKEAHGAGKGNHSQTQADKIKNGQQQRMYKEIKEMNSHLQKNTHANVLLVLDDVIGAIKKVENDPRLAELFMNRRHLVYNGTVSIIVVSQKYTMIPSRIRSTSSWVVLFRLNPKDFELAYEDVILLSKPAWQELLKFVFGKNAGDDSKESEGGGGGGVSDKYTNLGIWVEKNQYFKAFQQIDIQPLLSDDFETKAGARKAIAGQASSVPLGSRNTSQLSAQVTH